MSTQTGKMGTQATYISETVHALFLFVARLLIVGLYQYQIAPRDTQHLGQYFAFSATVGFKTVIRQHRIVGVINYRYGTQISGKEVGPASRRLEFIAATTGTCPEVFGKRVSGSGIQKLPCKTQAT